MLKLYYPVKPSRVNQVFGVNGAWYRHRGINIEGHNGIDFNTYRGQPVYASHDGYAYVGLDSSEGHGVVIRTKDRHEYKGAMYHFKTIYWHLLPNIPVKNGQEVKAGDLIGYADSTGLSTGDHLHYGLKAQAAGELPNTWYNLGQNNGFMGAIDPAPYLNEGKFYAQDLRSVKSILAQTISIYQKILELLRK